MTPRLKISLFSALFAVPALLTLVSLQVSSETPEDKQYRRTAPQPKPLLDVYNPFKVITDSSSLEVAGAPVKSLSDRLALLPDDYQGRIRAHYTSEPDVPANPSQDKAMHLRLRAVFSALEPVKQVWTDHFREVGRWQADQDNYPETIHTDIVDSLPGTGGDIRLLLSSDYGDDPIIRLIPAYNPKTTETRWHCQTSLPNRWLGRGKERLCIYNPSL